MIAGGVVVGLARSSNDTLLHVEGEGGARCCVRVCEGRHRVGLYDRVRWEPRRRYPPLVYWDALAGRGEVPLGMVGLPFKEPYDTPLAEEPEEA